MALEDELFDIERGFWLSGEEHFLQHLEDDCLLAFPQVGEMHGVFGRERVAATATTANRWRDLRLSDRHLLRPRDDVAIISYRADVTGADGQPYSALVSSAYVHRMTAGSSRFINTPRSEADQRPQRVSALGRKLWWQRRGGARIGRRRSFATP